MVSIAPSTPPGSLMASMTGYAAADGRLGFTRRVYDTERVQRRAFAFPSRSMPRRFCPTAFLVFRPAAARAQIIAAHFRRAASHSFRRCGGVGCDAVRHPEIMEVGEASRELLGERFTLHGSFGQRLLLVRKVLRAQQVDRPQDVEHVRTIVQRLPVGANE